MIYLLPPHLSLYPPPPHTHTMSKHTAFYKSFHSPSSVFHQAFAHAIPLPGLSQSLGSEDLRQKRWSVALPRPQRDLGCSWECRWREEPRSQGKVMVTLRKSHTRESCGRAPLHPFPLQAGSA